MSKPKIFRTLYILLTVISLSACNMPFIAPEPTATATFTATALPSNTPLPTNTPVTPTETPTLALPTETPTFTLIPPTATATKIPTRASIYPIPRSFFSGTFDNGKLTFRIGTNQYLIIPKSITVKKAVCQEGGTISQTINFEPPPNYRIEDGKFTINYEGIVVITGYFQSTTRATGTITLNLKTEKKCTIGPLYWNASGVLP